MRPRPSSFVLIALAAVSVSALDNGAARKPPMGWSTWNKLRCHFNETVLLGIGQAMKDGGMVDAGYASINIDDCWPLKQRAADGTIVPDPSKFPDGMKAFSAKLVALGLGLGIYTSHSNLTCQKFPGSLGHEAQDAASYASWGVSFVKNDWCSNRPGFPATDDLGAFNALRDALAAATKAAAVPPMVYSIHWNYWNTKAPGCALATSCPLPATANMWRIGNDIGANWKSVLGLIDVDTPLAANAGPGHWNDADMMQVGNGMTEDQDRAHMTMWCMLSSPLVAGNDVRSMSAVTRSILTNAHAIAVNQDDLGLQATLVNGTAHPTRAPDPHATVEQIMARAADTPPSQVWAKRLASPAGAWALALLNRDDGAPATISASFAEAVGAAPGAKFDVLDLWADAQSIGVHTDSISAKLAPSSAVMYKLVPAAV